MQAKIPQSPQSQWKGEVQIPLAYEFALGSKITAKMEKPKLSVPMSTWSIPTPMISEDEYRYSLGKILYVSQGNSIYDQICIYDVKDLEQESMTDNF